jgi:hypothetical protein
VTHQNARKLSIRKFSYRGMMLSALLLAGVTLAVSEDDRKSETIDATATGTSTQLGENVSVKVTIYGYSIDEDRQILLEAFKKGQRVS